MANAQQLQTAVANYLRYKGLPMTTENLNRGMQAMSRNPQLVADFQAPQAEGQEPFELSGSAADRGRAAPRAGSPYGARGRAGTGAGDGGGRAGSPPGAPSGDTAADDISESAPAGYPTEAPRRPTPGATEAPGGDDVYDDMLDAAALGGASALGYGAGRAAANVWRRIRSGRDPRVSGPAGAGGSRGQVIPPGPRPRPGGMGGPIIDVESEDIPGRPRVAGPRGRLGAEDRARRTFPAANAEKLSEGERAIYRNVDAGDEGVPGRAGAAVDQVMTGDFNTLYVGPDNPPGMATLEGADGYAYAIDTATGDIFTTEGSDINNPTWRATGEALSAGDMADLQDAIRDIPIRGTPVEPEVEWSPGRAVGTLRP